MAHYQYRSALAALSKFADQLPLSLHCIVDVHPDQARPLLAALCRSLCAFLHLIIISKYAAHVCVCVSPRWTPHSLSLSCSPFSLVVLLFYRSPFQFLSLCPHVTAVQIFSKTKLIPIFVFVENFGVANITTTATTTMPGRR